MNNRALAMAILLFASVVCSVASPLTAHATTTPVLTARWTFDGISEGQNAPDSIGLNTALPGGVEESSPTPSNDVPPVSYTNTTSMQFDGSNFFTIDNPVAKNFTICAWIKTTSSGGGTNHWESAPIMDSEVGGVAYDFGFGIGNGGKLMFGNGGVYPGDDPEETGAYWDQQVNGATTVNDNAWHNVCVTRDGDTGQNILYVDATVDGSGFSGIGTQHDNSQARIGWGYDGAALYQGLIDDVRVYNGVLTQAQLQNLTDGSDNPDLAPGDDGDGVDAATEDGAPNSGDANNDGTPDSQQINVSSFVSSVSSHYVSIATDNACSLSEVQSKDSSTVAADGEYSYPVGLVNFKAACSSTEVKLFFYDPPAGEFVVRKFINGHYQTINDATVVRTTIGGHPVAVVTYQLTDGGALDADGVINGEIVDPVGIALAANSLADTGASVSAMMTVAVVLCITAFLGLSIVARRSIY